MTRVSASRRGTTILELLIGIAVMTMITGIVIVYGGGSRKQVALYVETAKFAQVMVRAKSQSVLLYYNPASPTCGYGIRTFPVKGRYALFRYRALPGEVCTTIPFISADRYEEIEVYTLPTGVEFADIGSAPRDVLFVPPDPATYFWSGAVKGSGSTAFTLRTDDGNGEKTVTVNSGGQISY